MTDTYFPLLGDEHSDDLPRTLRRERDAREREARERDAKARGPTLTHDMRKQAPALHAVTPAPATVMRFDVPFTHLVRFFLKSALAALPALVLLGTLLWVAITLVRTNYPELTLGGQQPGACRAAAADSAPPLLARVTSNAPLPAAEAKAAPVRKRVAADKVKMTRN